MQMQRKIQRAWQRKAAMAALTVFTAASYGTGYAMPQGGEVKAGDAEIKTSGNIMDVNQNTQKVAIDWKGFDIAKQETVNFNQPNASAIALNRVIGNKGSEIYGHLNANGQVFLINPNGVLFGKGAEISVGGLIATTHNINNDDFMNSKGSYTFSGDSTNQVKNAGTIKAEGGLVALLAADVANEGVIQTNAGTTALGAGQSMTIDYENDGKINFAVNKSVANAKALNSGSIQANGGYVIMTARDASETLNTVVNNTGVIEAKSLKNVNGEIVLDGGDQGVVEVGGTIDTSGDEAGGTGGTIKAIGLNTEVTGSLKATGDQAGGLIETSGKVLNIDDNAQIDASSTNGKAGEWLLDPLMVVISNHNSTSNASNGTWAYSGNGTENTMSYVQAGKINDLLNTGTSVKIQATDTNAVASIEVDAAITKTKGKEASLTLEAQRNVTVNEEITSKSGKLNVNLHSDTDGDSFGAVIVNADITTNGGAFASGSGKQITDSTVGTYFGHVDNETGNRTITTNGGDINLYGDVALGLDGASLNLNTVKGKSTGGKVNITGNVDSGNSYKAYTDNATDSFDWKALLEKYYNAKLKGTSGYTTTKDVVDKGTTRNKDVAREKQNEGYTVEKKNGVYTYTKMLTTTVGIDYADLSSAQKNALSTLVAQTWSAAKDAAELDNTTTDTSVVGAKYLATITTSLENSIANSTIGGKQNELLIGGHRSDGTGKVSTNNTDAFYWLTGPEGQANNGTGVKFANADGTAVDINDSTQYYVNWAPKSASSNGKSEPNYSGSNVAVGWTSSSLWDDVSEGNATVHGFIQETNLNNSALQINAGNGAVEIDKNVGSSRALSNIDIQTTGTVKVKGAITSDAAVTIGSNAARAASAEVGEQITSGTATNIYTTGNITTNGVDAGGKILMSSNGGSYDAEKNVLSVDAGVITINGALTSDSTDNDAVVIDTKGRFVNKTTTASAITTGKGGNWKVYSASPYLDTFGTNLNSNTSAKWASTSDTYDKTTDENRYVFAYRPTAIVAATDGQKIYGDDKSGVTYVTSAKGQYEREDGTILKTVNA